MSINDPLGDMLARIRNAQMRHKTKVTTPASKLREHVLDVLAEGAISAATPASTIAAANLNSRSS